MNNSIPAAWPARRAYFDATEAVPTPGQALDLQEHRAATQRYPNHSAIAANEERQRIALENSWARERKSKRAAKPAPVAA